MSVAHGRQGEGTRAGAGRFLRITVAEMAARLQVVQVSGLSWLPRTFNDKCGSLLGAEERTCGNERGRKPCSFIHRAMDPDICPCPLS
jgi:hypothetical protein